MEETSEPWSTQSSSLAFSLLPTTTSWLASPSRRRRRADRRVRREWLGGEARRSERESEGKYRREANGGESEEAIHSICHRVLPISPPPGGLLPRRLPYIYTTEACRRRRRRHRCRSPPLQYCLTACRVGKEEEETRLEAKFFFRPPVEEGRLMTQRRRRRSESGRQHPHIACVGRSAANQPQFEVPRRRRVGGAPRTETPALVPFTERHA
jgi:hypothetical protein